MIKTVIFDLDGTTLYTLDSIAKSTNHVLQTHAFAPLPVEAYKKIVGNGVYDLLDGAFTLAGGDGTMVTRSVLDEFRVYFKQDRAFHVKPYDGIPAVLCELKQRGFHLACNTNKPEENAKLIISEYFGEIFDLIVGQKDGVPKKPDKAGGEFILRHFGCSKEEAVYVGDSNVDMCTAGNIGCVSIGALWGYRDEAELRANGAMYLARSPGEIVPIIESLNR